MNTDDKIITLESYTDPMLAHIIRTRLEANGIPCFVADDNTIGGHPIYNRTAGGVKLRIFEKDLERCREILATEGDLHENDHFEIDDETNTYVVCPYCGSTNVVNISERTGENEWPGFLDAVSNLINPFHSDKNWYCYNCKHDFE